jgi:cellulose synthase (UDP-forming)
MIRPFGRPFKVTAKGLDRTKTMVHWKLFGFFLALTLFSQFGAYIAISTAAAFDGNMVFNLCWTVVALIYNLATLVACVDRPRLHGEERFPFDKPTGFRFGGKVLPGRLVDISLSGASLNCAFASSIKPGLCGQMWVDKVGWLDVEVMRNHGKDQLGLRFAELDEGLRRQLIARLFSDASINVVSKADPALAFGTLLRRSLLGEKRRTPRLPAPARTPSYTPLPSWRPVVVRSRKQSLPPISASRSGVWSVLLSPLRALLGQRF